MFKRFIGVRNVTAGYTVHTSIPTMKITAKSVQPIVRLNAIATMRKTLPVKSIRQSEIDTLAIHTAVCV